MNENEFTLANATLENEVKLSCSLEETTTGKKIRLEFRNQRLGLNSPLIMSADSHLNYTISSEEEATRLVAYLTGLIALM